MLELLSRCFLDFSVGVGAFVMGLSQIPFPLSFSRSTGDHVNKTRACYQNCVVSNSTNDKIFCGFVF